MHHTNAVFFLKLSFFLQGEVTNVQIYMVLV
jgi:hypothetical protein